ncbi:hypothetical protein, partial [Xanthomonas campestris]|uniref:hypothetical protein n=1 Tax=Xanthomonas campestris TaxID=339 RepID=UPI001F23A0B1
MLFSFGCLRVNQRNGSRQVRAGLKIWAPSKSKKSEKQDLKERSKSALMQCFTLRAQRAPPL